MDFKSLAQAAGQMEDFFYAFRQLEHENRLLKEENAKLVKAKKTTSETYLEKYFYMMQYLVKNPIFYENIEPCWIENMRKVTNVTNESALRLLSFLKKTFDVNNTSMIPSDLTKNNDPLVRTSVSAFISARFDIDYKILYTTFQTLWVNK
mgnify:CR=1 FL=1